MHTWNDQSLATHNEDDLHWTELINAHLLSLIQGIAEFGDKDCTDTADADGEGDVRGAAKPVEGDITFRKDNGFGVLDTES